MTDYRKYICDECIAPCYFEGCTEAGGFEEQLAEMCPGGNWREVASADEPIPYVSTKPDFDGVSDFIRIPPNMSVMVRMSGDGGVCIEHVECPGCKEKEYEIRQLKEGLQIQGDLKDTTVRGLDDDLHNANIEIVTQRKEIERLQECRVSTIESMTCSVCMAKGLRIAAYRDEIKEQKAMIASLNAVIKTERSSGHTRRLSEECKEIERLEKELETLAEETMKENALLYNQRNEAHKHLDDCRRQLAEERAKNAGMVDDIKAIKKTLESGNRRSET